MSRTRTCSCLALVLCGALATVRAGSLARSLERALVQAAPDDLVPVVVLMDEFPETPRLLDEVRGLDRAARRAHVLSTMRALTERSQRGLRARLELERERGQARGPGWHPTRS